MQSALWEGRTWRKSAGCLFDSFHCQTSQGFKTSAVGLLCCVYHLFGELRLGIFFCCQGCAGEREQGLVALSIESFHLLDALNAGVWIETGALCFVFTRLCRHALAGVWIETLRTPLNATLNAGHALAGVWIETLSVHSLVSILPCHALAGVVD